jgi:hypothetical protein
MSMPAPEIIDEILRRLSEGEGLNGICKTEGFPAESSVRYWATNDPDFSARYTRARDLGIDAQAEGTIAIADDLTIHPDHKRLMIDSRKWFAGKMRPKKYGDQISLTGEGGAPLTVNLTIRAPGDNA